MAIPPSAGASAETELCDVLVVGAGPTGLTLAAQLARFGVQPRTLEVLRGLGVADELVRRGNPNTRLYVHRRGGHVTSSPMFDIGVGDTAYPFLLFLAQSETEAVLIDRLAADGITVERNTHVQELDDNGDHVMCTTRNRDGATQLVRARYVVGCDGAHSTVRSAVGIEFAGGRYPQTFLLADLAVAGLEPDGIHVYIGPSGPLLFFPLKVPAPWRLITVRPSWTAAAPEGGQLATAVGPVTGTELSGSDLVAAATNEPLQLQEPVWATAFHVSHRHAGDAAHVHSPAGAQGMNTGIHDAVNLGWKLALVLRSSAPSQLLDSYDAERRPVGVFVLRFTDRAFTVVTSDRPFLRAIRTVVAPRALPLLLGSRVGRRVAFRTVSQLGIRYASTFASEPEKAARRRWKLLSRKRPEPGHRLPDALVVRDGEEIWLHEALADPALRPRASGPSSRPQPRSRRLARRDR